MHNILRRQKTGVTRRRRKKSLLPERQERCPTPGWIVRLKVKQHGPSASKGSDLLLIHPSAPQLSDPFGYNQQGRCQTCSLNSQKQPKASGLRWTSLFKEIHMYIYTHTYIPNAQGRRKSIRLWPTPWTWHVREEGWPGAHLCFGTQSGHGPAWRQTTTGGLRCLCVTRLQEEIKPHRHYTGLRAVAQSHDFTSTPGTAARKYVIIEWPVI